jgi:MFS family permease
VLIGLGQGIALPLLIGAVLAHVRPERAGAAAGILTTTQQFGAASGIAVIGAIFYAVLGTAPDRGPFVSGMVAAISVNAVLVAIAAAATWLLPRRAAARPVSPGQEAAARPVSPGQEAAAAGRSPAMSHAFSPAREHAASAADQRRARRVTLPMSARQTRSSPGSSAGTSALALTAPQTSSGGRCSPGTPGTGPGRGLVRRAPAEPPWPFPCGPPVRQVLTRDPRALGLAAASSAGHRRNLPGHSPMVPRSA